MSDNYLWDGSGKPDPEVERLETLLATLREDVPAPAFEMPERRTAWRWWPALPRFAAVAAMLVIVIGATLLMRVGRQTSWAVTRVEGAPRVASHSISDNGRLKIGEWLETDSASRAIIDIGMIGEVEVKPDSRVQLLRADASDHRLSLQRGAIFARIWAPPRLFSVETPSANAVDMGCVYRLEVDASGASLLHVETGLVTIERNGRESLVPAGAMCLTRPGDGPGTPYYEDASEKFKQALAELDPLLALTQGISEAKRPSGVEIIYTSPDVADKRTAALNIVLAESRKRDALTLWHLLTRVAPDEKNRIYDRMAQLVPPPAGVTREGILSGDAAMRDAWADQLGIGSMTWWRFFWKKAAAL
jgi:hypothetical protein